VSLGILGGTFNPIHLAHLRVAEEVREALGLERVLFVPSGDPPHKLDALELAERRHEMVRLAVETNPAFEVLDLELRRAGPSYTVDTLEELGRTHPGQRLWFIIGSDAFEELETWHRPARLFELASLAVVQRPGQVARPVDAVLPEKLARPFRATARGLEHASGNEIRSVAISELAISATDIRARIARGASIRYLVPRAVIEYIRKNGLYREES
jgi:nicotinate-nucleotide adenylyltransferase